MSETLWKRPNPLSCGLAVRGRWWDSAKLAYGNGVTVDHNTVQLLSRAGLAGLPTRRHNTSRLF